MTTSTCSRTWEVEASRDGRLSQGARASFEQHCAACAACREAAEHLDTVAAQLRAANPALDEMASRRLRQKILRDANALVLSLATAPLRSSTWKVGAGVLSALALAFAILHAHFQRGAAPTPRAGVAATRLTQPAEQFESGPAPSEVLAQGEQGSIWSRRRAGGREEIALLEGTLSLDVRHPARLGPGATTLLAPTETPEPRVIVRVPDGEILDLGTRFRVVVHHQQTQEIAVTEGVVLFQRPGFADVRVEQGSTWRARADETNALTRSSSANPTPQPGPSAPDSAAAARAGRDAGQSSKRKPPFSDGTSAAASQGSEQNSRAAEDAAYLNWIALLRAGRRSAAQRAGLDYLHRFPHGFRRAEVQAVVAPLTAVPADAVGMSN